MSVSPLRYVYPPGWGENPALLQKISKKIDLEITRLINERNLTDSSQIRMSLLDDARQLITLSPLQGLELSLNDLNAAGRCRNPVERKERLLKAIAGIRYYKDKIDSARFEKLRPFCEGCEKRVEELDPDGSLRRELDSWPPIWLSFLGAAAGWRYLSAGFGVDYGKIIGAVLGAAAGLNYQSAAGGVAGWLLGDSYGFLVGAVTGSASPDVASAAIFGLGIGGIIGLSLKIQTFVAETIITRLGPAFWNATMANISAIGLWHSVKNIYQTVKNPKLDETQKITVIAQSALGMLGLGYMLYVSFRGSIPNADH